MFLSRSSVVSFWFSDFAVSALGFVLSKTETNDGDA